MSKANGSPSERKKALSLWSRCVTKRRRTELRRRTRSKTTKLQGSRAKGRGRVKSCLLGPCADQYKCLVVLRACIQTSCTGTCKNAPMLPQCATRWAPDCDVLRTDVADVKRPGSLKR